MSLTSDIVFSMLLAPWKAAGNADGDHDDEKTLAHVIFSLSDDPLRLRCPRLPSRL